jgi:hypothetical protein
MTRRPATKRVVADITEDTIRAVALPLGLVDIKACGRRSLVRIEAGGQKRTSMTLAGPRALGYSQSEVDSL